MGDSTFGPPPLIKLDTSDPLYTTFGEVLLITYTKKELLAFLETCPEEHDHFAVAAFNGEALCNMKFASMSREAVEITSELPHKIRKALLKAMVVAQFDDVEDLLKGVEVKPLCNQHLPQSNN